MRLLNEALHLNRPLLVGLGRDPDAPDGRESRSSDSGGGDSGGGDRGGGDRDSGRSNRDRGTEERMRDIASGKEARERAEARERRDRNEGVSEVSNAPQQFDRAAAVAQRAFTQAVAQAPLISAIEGTAQDLIAAGTVKPSKLWRNLNKIVSTVEAPLLSATTGPLTPGVMAVQNAGANYLDFKRTVAKAEKMARAELGLGPEPGTSRDGSSDRETVSGSRTYRGSGDVNSITRDRTNGDGITYRETAKGKLTPATPTPTAPAQVISQGGSFIPSSPAYASDVPQVVSSEKPFNPLPWLIAGLLFL